MVLEVVARLNLLTFVDDRRNSFVCMPMKMTIISLLSIYST